MKRRLAKIMFALVSATLVVGLGVYWLNREPQYQGRPLSEWTKQAASHDAALRKEAHAALEAMGDEAVPHLAGSLVKGETVLEKINRAIGDKVPQRLKRQAIKLFGVQRAIERKTEAIRALELMGTNALEAVPALAQILRDPNVLLSSMAGVALGKLGPAAVPELVRALDEGDFNVRANACSALANLQTNSLPAAPRLTRILEEENGPILPRAAYTLSRIGQGALPAMDPAFAHTNWVTRRWAAFAVGFMVPGPKDAAARLYPLTRDPHPEVRMIAVESLGRMYVSSPESIAVIRECFTDPVPEVRTAAMQAFANAPWMVLKHMEACIGMLEDSSPKVRGYAAEALMKVSPLSKPAVPLLEKVAQDEDAFARDRALMALKTLKKEG